MSIWDNKHLPDPKSIRALALDLDGTTLAPGGKLSERTARAVKLCRQRGLRIILATGRAIEGAEPFRSAFGAEGPMVYYNGAILVDMPQRKFLKTALLDMNVAEFCVNFARDMGVYAQIYVTGESDESRIPLLAELDSPHREWYYNVTGVLAELVDFREIFKQPKLPGCVKAMFLTEPDTLAEIRLELEKCFGGSILIAQTNRTFLEVTGPNASKGLGLKFVMEYCSIAKQEIIAFGDEENDLPMFSVAGFFVVPSNGKDMVKAKADLVIGPNTEDGLAVFLEEFFNLETGK
jgi:hypothetical protein